MRRIENCLSKLSASPNNPPDKNRVFTRLLIVCSQLFTLTCNRASLQNQNDVVRETIDKFFAPFFVLNISVSY